MKKNLTKIKYNLRVLMAVVAARQLEDEKSVAVGTGLPLVAAMLAQKTHAPNLVIFFEAGGIAPQLPILPISVGDSRTIHRALCTTTLIDIMDTMRRGYIDYAFFADDLSVRRCLCFYPTVCLQQPLVKVIKVGDNIFPFNILQFVELFLIRRSARNAKADKISIGLICLHHI